MKRTAIAAFILVAAIAFVAGVWCGVSRDLSRHAVAGEICIPRYSCPMHPRYFSDKAGVCPSCGMRLAAGNTDSSEPDRIGGGDARTPLSSIRVTPEQQQILGVRTGIAERTSGSRTIRVTGRVAVDENRAYRINAPMTGWIREIFPNRVGSPVRRNQRLAAFSALEFSSPQQAYLYRLDALDHIQSAGAESAKQIALAEANIQGAADILRSMGMHDIQIEELRRTRRPAERIVIYSPATGFVLKRNVDPGMRFEAGTEFYRIADLSRVWILADIFENDARIFKPGTPATVVYHQQKARFAARVDDALPQFDPASRTLTVRLMVDNPDFTLCPGMYVDVALSVGLPAAITVPAEAIVDTGLRETVFVDLGNGNFEPRAIQTGWRTEAQVEIIAGLMVGERVVIGGSFLLDSESRLSAAAPGLRTRTVEGPEKQVASGGFYRHSP